LLRACAERQTCRSAGNQCYELAPLHGCPPPRAISPLATIIQIAVDGNDAKRRPLVAIDGTFVLRSGYIRLIAKRLPTITRYAPYAISSARLDIACAARTPSGAVNRPVGITSTAPISEI
jgi:hypothetical protein